MVEAASGERVGKVAALLRRDGEVYVAVTPGGFALTRNLFAVPWDEVASVDHSGLRVRLSVDEGELERALELDPDNAVEQGDADAVRLTELPPELRQPSPPGEAAGPVDRPPLYVALGLTLVGVFSFLVLAIFARELDSGWYYALFAVPVAILALGASMGYRAYRDPSARTRTSPSQSRVESPGPPS